MSLPNPGMSFTPFDPLPASELNDVVENVEALAAGTGLDDLSIATAKIQNSAVNYLKLAAGIPVQVVNATFTSVATGTTVLPDDSSTPLNTEGTEFMTLAITPKSATNILVIEIWALLASSVTADITGALFKDAGTCLAAGSLRAEAAAVHGTLNFKHVMVAGTTSSTTFKLRAGASTAGTVTFNGKAGSVLFGSTVKSGIVITEYKA